MAEFFEYLDELRDSGETNMMGAAIYLESDHGIPRVEARKILTAWMKTFDPSKLPMTRAQEALAGAS